MATKTNSVDVEAYRRLKNAKKEGESFSQVIKRVVPRPFDYQTWMKEMEANPLSDEAVAAVEAVIEQRRHRVNMGRPRGTT